MHSFSDDSAYAIVNLLTDTEPTNSSSPADDTTRKTAVGEETNQVPQSPHLAAINVFADSGVPTIVEDQDSVLDNESPVLKAPVCDAQDDKQPTTQDNESHVTTIPEETITTDCQTEDRCTNGTSTSSPSPGVCLDDTLKLPAASENLAPRSSYMVAIRRIPCDDSSIPMLAEDKVNCDPCTPACSDETVKIQRNPAYDVIDDKFTTANQDQTVKMQRNPAYDVIDDKFTTANQDQTVKMQRNPAYDAIDDKFTTANQDQTVKMQRNLAYNVINDKFTTANQDETVKMQRNPAYTAINHASSEVYSYDYVTVFTTSANDTATTSIKMQQNPAYTTVNHCHRSTQQNS